MRNTTDQNKIIFDIFKEAIAIEIYGREYYSIFSDLMRDEVPKKIFRKLSEDENEHREILEKEYKKITGRSMDIGTLNEESREKARRIFPESLEPLSITESKDILKLGIRTEERSIELYSMSAERTDRKSGKDLFLKLVHFEEEHRDKLIDALKYLEQQGSWQGYTPR